MMAKTMQTFTLPNGEKFTTDNYTTKSNTATGTTILRATHQGKQAVKMVRGGVSDVVADAPMGESEYGPEGREFYGENVEEMDMSNDNDHNSTALVNPRQGLVTDVIGIPWQALRLIRGTERELGLLRPFHSSLERLGVRGKAVRGTYIVQLVDARLWQRYIDNMTMQDVGAELNAPVSVEERAIIHHFLKSIQLDGDRTQLLRRCVDSSQADTLAKAGIVQRLMGGNVQPHQNLDISTTSFDRMYRLALDIIRSLRIEEYNYYELPMVRAKENAQIHQSVMTRYVPPTQQEVAILEEMKRMAMAQGRNYAFRTTNNNHDPISAFELMLATISNFERGDIRTMRTNLDILLKPPYNYKPESGYSGMFDPGSPDYAGHQPLLVVMKDGKNAPPQQHWMLYNENLALALKKDGQLDMKRLPEGVYTEVVGPTNAKPIARWMKKGGGGGGGGGRGGGGGLTKISEEEFASLSRQADLSDTGEERQRRGEQRILDEKRRDSENRTQGRGARRRGGGGGGGGGGRPPRGRDMDPRQDNYRGPQEARANPGYGGEVTLGRGKFLYVQLLPKTQVTFSKKLTDEERKLGKTQGERKLGLTKLVPPKESYGGVFVHTGKHKITGEETPWLIRLPTSHFRAVNTNVDGKNVRTIALMKGSPELRKAFAKFGDTYGMPVFKSTKSLPTRFIIPKKFQGKFFDTLQRKIAKKRGKKA